MNEGMYAFTIRREKIEEFVVPARTEEEALKQLNKAKPVSSKVENKVIFKLDMAGRWGREC